MISLTRDIIDYHALTEQVRRNDCGGVVTFLGTVRELTEGKQTVALDYEGYPGMAEKKMAEIEKEVRESWPIGATCAASTACPKKSRSWINASFSASRRSRTSSAPRCRWESTRFGSLAASR